VTSCKGCGLLPEFKCADERCCWMCGDTDVVYQDVIGMYWCECCVTELENSIEYRHVR
jgi:hypothetical protein